jgi:hypothetical protein
MKGVQPICCECGDPSDVTIEDAFGAHEAHWCWECLQRENPAEYAIASTAYWIAREEFDRRSKMN